MLDPSPGDLAKDYLKPVEPDVFVEAQPGLPDRIGAANTELDFENIADILNVMIRVLGNEGHRRP